MRSEESGTKYSFYKKSIEKVRTGLNVDGERGEETEDGGAEDHEE